MFVVLKAINSLPGISTALPDRRVPPPAPHPHSSKMERLDDDVLGYILIMVLDSRDRNSCYKVCKQWRRVEGLTRASLRVLESQLLRRFLPRYCNLRSLQVGGPLSDAELSFVAETCPRLRELYLNRDRSLVPRDNFYDEECTPFGDRGLRAVAARCRDLGVIHLKKRKRVGDTGVACLVEAAKGLTVLDLSFCSKITDRALGGIGKGASSLQALYLRGCYSITDNGLVSLAVGSLRATLKILDLSDCDRITDVGMLQLKMMFVLEELNLSDCGVNITDNGGVAFNNMQSLKRLDVSWVSNLSDETIAGIAKHCLNLRVLDVKGCELVTGAGLRHFAGHNSLEVLRAASSHFSAEDVETLVLGCKSLKYVGLDSSLRGWMPSVQERLGGLCSMVWH